MKKEVKLDINGKEFCVTIHKFGTFEADLEVNGRKYIVGLKDLGIEKVADVVAKSVREKEKEPLGELASQLNPQPQRSVRPATVMLASSIISPLPGLIIDIKVNVGDTVTEGQSVLIMEAMKMENDIRAQKDGVVAEIKVKVGDSVVENDVLIILG